MSKRKSGRVVARLGPRYGRTVRRRLGQIETELRKKHLCPSCNSLKVKRISVGIWKCAKCSFTFSGGAYLPTSRIGTVAQRSVRK